MRPSTLPDPVDHEIQRDSLVYGLQFQLDANPIVLVNGPSNVGKTTLLAQFYERNKKATLATFISGASVWGYDYETITFDLCDQARDIANLPSPQTGAQLDTSTAQWRTAFAELCKVAERNKASLYFILDGLDEIPDQQESAALALFSLMPLGRRWLKFLLCGNRVQKYVRNSAVKNFGEFTVTPFTPEDANKYLAGVLPADEAAKLYPLSKGIPGYYASVRRIMQSQGQMPSTPPTSLSKLFEYEWNRVKSTALLEDFMAFLCFNRDDPTFERIADFLGVAISDLATLARTTNLLEEKNGRIYFAHESLKTFIQGKVTHLEKRTIDRIIDGILGSASASKNNQHLPELLSQAGRNDELIAYLDDSYILAAIRQRRAARFVQERALIGFRAATKQDKTEEVIRFGLQGANLDELYLDDHWAQRIRAFISLGELPTAFKIARSFSVPEDRLQALCSIALHERKANGRIDESLVDEITREHSLLDRDHLGKRAYDIAASLVYILPQQALALIKNVSALESKSPATAEQNVSTTIAPSVIESAEDCKMSALEILRNRIKDPELRTFLRVVGTTSKGDSGDRVMAELERMATDEEKAYFLRLWLADNRTHGGREMVVRYALRFAIASKDVSPTPSFFFDVVGAIEGLATAKELLLQVRAIIPQIKRVGPTADYYRLRLRMLEVDSTEDYKSASKEYAELFAEIAAIGDPSTRCHLLAQILIVLFRVKQKSSVLENRQLVQDANSALEESVSSVLSTTADHYQALKRAVRQLARIDCLKAHAIVARFNTENRRDMGYCDVVYQSIAGRLKAADLAIVNDSFVAIVDPHTRARCLLMLLKTLCSSEKSAVGLFHYEHIYSWCQTLEGTDSKALALAYYAIVQIRYGGKKPIELQWIDTKISHLIEQIDDPIERIATLHSLTFIFADHDKEIARKYLEQGERLRDSLLVKTGVIEECLVRNLRVAIRAFSGLIRRQAFSEVELYELVALINALPNVSAKVRLFTNLAVHFHLAEDGKNCRRIYTEFIKPLVASASLENKMFRDSLIVVSAPASYGANPFGCLAALEDLEATVREDAVQQILEVRITKLCADEPYQGIWSLDERTSSADILEILKLVGYLGNDNELCYRLQTIVQFFEKQRVRISRTEKEEIIARIESLVKSKLPSKKYFSAHEGYGILGESYVLSIKGAKAPEWEALIARTEVIPNVSDRVFLFASLASLMGPKLLPQRKKLLEEALETLDKIPVAYDRGDRALTIADLAKPLDHALFVRAISAILGAPQSDDADERNGELKRRAIDMAYAEDEALANRMVTALDDDPSRDIKKRLKQRLELLNLQRRVTKRELDGLDLKDSPDIPEIFWRNLRRLNAGLIEAPKFKSLAPLFLAIEGRRIEDIYPILSFCVESCVRNYSSTDEAFGVPLRIFRVCLSSTRLFVNCLGAGKDAGMQSTLPSSETVREDQNQIIVKKGEKDRACDFIRLKLANAETGRVYLVDPYFTATDLDLIEIVRTLYPESPIHILTGKKNIQEKYGDEGAPAAFRRGWKERYGDRDIGDVKVFVVGEKGSLEPPIHDRFLALEKIGIKFGGSWNGIGGDKEMDIRTMDLAATQQWRKEADCFLLYMHAHFNGRPLIYDICSL